METQPTEPDEPNLCLEGNEQIKRGHAGIVTAAIDHTNNAVVLDYDPERISESELQQAAAELRGQLAGTAQKCTMRLAGRACEACALRLEQKAEKLPGIRRARATFIGGTMTVVYDQEVMPAEQLPGAMRQIGAHVHPWGSAVEWFRSSHWEMIFTAATLVFILTGFVSAKAGAAPFMVNALYLLAYICGGFFGIQASWQSLKERTIDVDLLMILAALGAAYIGAPFEGATLLFLFSLSNVLQGYAIDRTRKAIHALMQLRPENAMVRRGKETVTVPIESLLIGDIIIVRPGERVALDGVVAAGQSSVDESSVTGESMPVSKIVGSGVFAGTINQTGGLEVRVGKLAKDSTIARLIQMVEEAQSEKAQTQRWLDKAEQYYAAGVILFTLGLIIVPLLLGEQSFAQIFYRAMTVMVVASPCALIISTPASILSAIGGAARRGILFKGGAHLENTAAVEVVVFDKTGTLTEGKPRVTDVIGLNSESEEDLLALAAAVEARSEHPLAQAIVQECERRKIAVPECTEFQSTSGQGATAKINGQAIAVGNLRYFGKGAENSKLLERMDALHKEGKTAMLVGKLVGTDAEMIGLIAVADVVRPDARISLERLRKTGIKNLIMLTGDNRHVAEAIARQVGIDEVHAELRPEDKLRIIKSLRARNPVAMVGDGVNDAPALAAANIGIAMGAAGTDVAMETADVVLMNNNLQNVAYAIELSRKARRVVFQNLAFALSVIVLLVAAALGLQLPLTLGVVGHEGSTVLVCLNGLRLLLGTGKS